MKPLAVAALLLLSHTVDSLAADNWVQVSKGNDNTQWEARAGSFEDTQTDRTGERIFVVMFRVKRPTGSTEFEKNYVTAKDCSAGYGKLVTTDLDGKALYSNQWVEDGGNVASTIATVICYLGKRGSENVGGSRF